MDRETVRELRNAHESSMILLTLLAERSDSAAADHVFSHPREYLGPTCMATAMVAIGALKTLAQMCDSTVEDLLGVAGISAAEMLLQYEKMIDDDDEG